MLAGSLVMTITCGCLTIWNCREKADFFNYFARYPSYDIFPAATHRRKMSISQAVSWILAASWFQIRVTPKDVSNLHLSSNFLLSAVVSTKTCRVEGSGGRQWSGARGQDQHLSLCCEMCPPEFPVVCIVCRHLSQVQLLFPSVPRFLLFREDMPVKDTKEHLKLHFVFKILRTSTIYLFFFSFEVCPKRLFPSSSGLCIEQ